MAKTIYISGGLRVVRPVAGGGGGGGETGDFWTFPSLQDETDTYSLLGWTVGVSDADFINQADPPVTGFGDLHNDTEGDNLWTWILLDQRHANAVTQAHVAAWLSECNSTLITELNTDDAGGNSGYHYDHAYGQGLAWHYYLSGGATTKTTLDQLYTALNDNLTRLGGVPSRMAYWEGRDTGRWTIIACYAAEATGEQKWIDMRDALQTGWINSLDWEEGGVIAEGGNYFASAEQAGYKGYSAEYAAGNRYNAAWMMGLIAEAHWRLYLQTSNVTIRERLVKMARYLNYYAHGDEITRHQWAHGNCGVRFGHAGDGDPWHPEGGDEHTSTTADFDPWMDVALVNSQVFGYKLSGESQLLPRAHKFIDRSCRFDYGAASPKQLAPYGEVYKYADTRLDHTTGGREFYFNKGWLQYAYQLFENGGLPAREGTDSTLQTQADALSFGSSAQWTGDNLTGAEVSVYSPGNDDTIFNYQRRFYYDPFNKTFQLIGKGQSPSDGRHFEYDESTDTWAQVGADNAWPQSSSTGHGYDSMAVDPATGDVYFVAWGLSQVNKWDAGTRSWSTTSAMPSYPSDAPAAEWHPRLFGPNSPGLIVTGNGTAHLWNPSTDSWSTISVSHHGIHSLAVYVPAFDAVVITGGAFNTDPNTEMYALRRNNDHGSMTPTSPVSTGAQPELGVMVPDPRGRGVLALHATANTSYLLRTPAGSWEQIDNHPFSGRLSSSGESWVCCSVPERGVVFGLNDNGLGAAPTPYLWKPGGGSI